MTNAERYLLSKYPALAPDLVHERLIHISVGDLVRLLDGYRPGDVNAVGHVPYQLCPKCAGRGNVPTYYGSTSAPMAMTCPVCAGEMIIPMHALPIQPIP